MLTKSLTQIGNNLFRASNGTMYQHKVGQRSRQVVGEDGMERTEHYNVSEGLVRLTPKGNALKKKLKRDKRL